jgi:hypothetical protein
MEPGILAIGWDVGIAVSSYASDTPKRSAQSPTGCVV